MAHPGLFSIVQGEKKTVRAALEAMATYMGAELDITQLEGPEARINLDGEINMVLPAFFHEYVDALSADFGIAISFRTKIGALVLEVKENRD